jgi:transposase-like protein
MSRRHIPREQKLDMVRLRANNPAVKIARDFGCSERTVRRVNHLAHSIGDVVRQPALCGRRRKLNGIHVAVSNVSWCSYHS